MAQATECVCVARTHPMLVVIHDERLVDRLFSLCSSPCSFPCVSPIPGSSLPTSTCTLSWTSSSMWTTPRQTLPAPPPIEESCSLAEFTPHTRTGARSKCGTITNLSLWKRRFDVKLISKTELLRHRETCGLALTSEKIGTRRTFWKRANCWCFKG